MMDGIGRGFPVTDRHGEKDASPQSHDVSHADRQIDEAKGEFDVLGKNKEQSAEEKEHGRIKGQQNA